MKIDESKLAKLRTTNELLNEKYGKSGTAQRNEFDAKALAWYNGTMLRPLYNERSLHGKVNEEASRAACNLS